MRRLMNVNINFYGHSVSVDPEDIAANLEPDASEEDIKEAVNEAVAVALEEDVFPSYTHDGDDVVERVQDLLAQRLDEEGEDA